ncbi:MAG: flagellar motor switch protein FliM [Methylosarcina sp.]
MSDPFTQEEIDALLSGIDEFDFAEPIEKETPVEESQTDNRVRNYDFTSRERIIRGRMPILDRVNARFSEYCGRSLSNFLGSAVEIESSGIQVQQFSEYTQGLPLQTLFAIAQFSPLPGRALFVLDPRLVFSLVDLYFGSGVQANKPIDKKPLSPVMMRVIRLVIDILLKDLKEAWKPVIELNCDYVGSETNSSYANIARPDEIAVISTSHLQLKGGGGNLSIAMPYSMIEPVKELLNNPSADNIEEHHNWQMAFRQQILRAEINVIGQLAEKKMTIGDIMRLKKGDVIPIDRPDAVVLSVQGIPLYEGRSKVSGGRNALQIVGKIGSNGLE